MVPGKAGVLRDTWGSAVGYVCQEEVIGVGKHREGRRPCRVRRDHMQQLHLYWIGQISDELISITGDRIRCGQLPHRSFEGTSRGIGRTWIAGDIDVGSRV